MSPVVGPVGQSVRLSCPVQCCDVPGSPILEARSAFWARVGPATCDQHSLIGGSRGAPTGSGGEQDERSCRLAECMLACLLACLPDLTIMNGHAAHRRQEGSQLAAEPACSRRVRAPSETWGDSCSRQVGEATTRRVTWAWGWPYGPSWRPFGLTPRHPMFTPPAAHQLGRADKHETVSREGSGITFL